MLETAESRRQLSKWIIGTVTCCALIYLGIRYISSITAVLGYVLELLMPLIAGAILALILNVPMRFFENLLKRKTNIYRGLRPLSIFLSVALILGIFTGVAVLVIPELMNAIRLIVQIANSSIDQMAHLNTKLEGTEIGQYLGQSSIDWSSLKVNLEQWIKDIGLMVASGVADTAGNFFSYFAAIVFGIYVLANKETMKERTCRFLRIWLPTPAAEGIIHVCSVCSSTFRLFIAGQATEAIILGSLCMGGMLILRIPYAPMVGALVGVTALIPIVGAFVGTIIGGIMILTVKPWKALVFIIFLLILQQIEGNMIYPKVVGSKLNLPAMWVLAAVTVGGNIGGPIGMLLGVPTAAAAYSLVQEATTLHEQRKYDTEKSSPSDTQHI